MYRLVLLLFGAMAGMALRAQTGEWVNYLQAETINDILEEEETVYIATNAGIFIWDKASASLQHHSRQSAGLPSNKVESIAREPLTRRLFIGTYDMALAYQDGGQWAALPYPEGLFPFGSGQEVLTYAIEFDLAGNLWVGTSAGLARYDGGDWLTYQDDHPFQLLRAVWDIQRGPEGQMFFASHGLFHTAGEEVVLLSPPVDFTTGEALFAYSDAHLQQLGDGGLWYITDVGAAGYYDGSQWEVFPAFDPEALISLNNLGFTAATPDHHLLAYLHGQGYFTYRDGQWQSAAPYPGADEQTPLGIAFVGAQVFEFVRGGLRIHSEGEVSAHPLGYYPFAGQLANFTSAPDGSLWARAYGRNELLNMETLETLPLPEAMTYFSSFQFAPNGDIWLLGHRQVMRLHGGDHTIYNSQNAILPDDGYYNSLAVDRLGQVWVGIKDRGLYRFDGLNWKHYNHPVFTSNAYFQIVPGAAGELWLSLWSSATGTRLARFAGEQLSLFTAAHSPVIGSLSALAYNHEDGRLWCAGYQSGFSSYDGQNWQHEPLPEGLPQQEYIQQLLLENGQIIAMGRHSVLLQEEDGWRIFTPQNSPLSGDYNQSMGLSKSGALWIAHNGWAVDKYQRSLVSDIQEEHRAPALHLNVFPNPAAESVQLSYHLPEGAERAILHAFTSDGRLVQSLPLPAALGLQQIDIRVDSWPNGLYILVLNSAGRVAAVKLMVD
jgi:ligand-binding sensor domain-containing protein